MDNDNNHPKNENDPTSNNSRWAEIVDQLGNSAHLENSDETKPVEQIELTPELLDDLELNGQLKILGKMSNPYDSFTNKVIAQTHPESNPVPLSGNRLPVLEPRDSFVNKVMAQTHPESSPADLNTSRLPVPEPSFATETSDTIAETNLAPSEDDLGDELLDSPLVTPSSERLSRQPVALFAALAATFLVGCFMGSMWWGGANPDIAVSPAPNVDVANIAPSQPTSEQPAPSQEDALVISSQGDADTDHDTADELLVEHAKNEDSNTSPLTALAEEIDGGDWNKFLEESSSDLDNSSNPNLATTEKKVDIAEALTEHGSKRSSEQMNPEDQTDQLPETHGPLWDSKFEWNLAIQFDRNGVGSVALNGEPSQAIFLQDNVVFLLRQIVGELERRVQFLDNRLSAGMHGSIQVGKSNYSFDNISELDEAIEKVDQYIAKFRTKSLGVEELMTLRAAYRKGIIANRLKFRSINLANRSLKFYTEDEAFAICAVLSGSEANLRVLAKQRLAWEKTIEALPSQWERENCIETEAFKDFADSGKLALPDPKSSSQSFASIQKLGPSELTRMLQKAPSIELFKDLAEFLKAKDYVFSHGPPEMKLRLAIDKIDRELGKVVGGLPDNVKGMLAVKKANLTRDMRRELAQSAGRNFGDAATLEPLKDFMLKRPDLQGLPLVMGKECQSDRTETADLAGVSRSLGRVIGEFNGSLGSRDVAQNDAFRNLSIMQMVSSNITDPSSQILKTIDQILQIDHPRLRLELIEALRKSDSDTAVKLMADKAKFDLEPEVRIAATDALADIEPDKYRALFLEGLKYPWHVVAEHSAEALIRLDDQDAIPKLIDMLELPHPRLPTENNGQFEQRELVGINHMRNCLLCHAPSINASESARGLIPHMSVPLPPHYYGSNGEAVAYAVRADITYLEQDFSIVQPVKNHGPWPREQRFDYVVQKKKMTQAEAVKAARQVLQTPNRNRHAVIYTLRALTGETPEDNSSDNWESIVAARQTNKN